MIDRLTGVANLKKCKKRAKSGQIDLQHITVLNPRKNRVLLANFQANRTNQSWDIAKSKTCLIDSSMGYLKLLRKEAQDCQIIAAAGPHPESVATLPPFSPIEGQKWFDQISSQWESQKNRFALTYIGKIQFLPPCIWILPFMSTASEVECARFA